MFNPENFIKEITPQILNVAKNEKIVAAVSGGVDSTTAAVLLYKTLGFNVVPIMINTGFLRKNETDTVKKLLENILPLQIIDKSKEFISSLEGIEDAEEKRKKFRNLFYKTISAIIKENNATFLAQGTIAADWIETQGGIKTQHNVLVQLGIDTEKTWGFKLIEPLADLYKDEVRALARYLGLPKELSERQPFPGPGLLIRTIGKLTKEKLEIVREANDIVEKSLENYSFSQYFAAIFESDKKRDEKITNYIGQDIFVYNSRATGVKGDVRSYGKIASINGKLDYNEIRKMVSEITKFDITHVLYKINEKENGKYSVVIRAIDTEDFMTADFAKISYSDLYKISQKILELDNVKEVLYDVTTKPPATIEFE